MKKSLCNEFRHPICQGQGEQREWRDSAARQLEQQLLQLEQHQQRQYRL